MKALMSQSSLDVSIKSLNSDESKIQKNFKGLKVIIAEELGDSRLERFARHF
jgi:chaperonin cofactor prefoldin